MVEHPLAAALVDGEGAEREVSAVAPVTVVVRGDETGWYFAAVVVEAAYRGEGDRVDHGEANCLRDLGTDPGVVDLFDQGGIAAAQSAPAVGSHCCHRVSQIPPVGAGSSAAAEQEEVLSRGIPHLVSSLAPAGVSSVPHPIASEAPHQPSTHPRPPLVPYPLLPLLLFPVEGGLPLLLSLDPSVWGLVSVP